MSEERLAEILGWLVEMSEIADAREGAGEDFEWTQDNDGWPPRIVIH